MRRKIAGPAAMATLVAGIGFVPTPAEAAAPQYSEAHAINNRGDVVGWSTNDTGHNHAVLWAAVGSTHGAAQDLGTLGGANSWAYGINDLGEIVGISEDASGAWQAFRWTPANGGTMTQLAGLPGALGCEAHDINDRSQVAGQCTISTSSGYAVRPVLWSDGQATDLDAGRSQVNGSAMGLNDRGEVFGSVDNDLILWSGTDRIQLGGTLTTSYGDVNDRSEAVGNWSNFGSGHGRLFSAAPWGGYQATDLGAFAGDISSVYDINERGEAVGFSYTADAIHGFVWYQGALTDIGTLGGSNSYAYGVNDRGEVVGQSHLASLELRAFVWANGTMTNLGVLS